MTAGGSTLRLHRITKHFGRVRVLDQVDAEIPAGSFTAILGPSGSGKSTLLMTILGFERPDSGSVLVDGVDITAQAPDRRGIGVVFQGYALFPHMSVADNIAYALRARGRRKAEILEKVAATARLMEIENLLGRLPSQISGGQRQRVAIARTIVFEPRLLLLDEPLSALDRNLRDRMKEELRRIHQRLGITIVMVTHDQDEATELADHILVMEHGAIIGAGAPRDLYRSPPNMKVAAFFGRSSVLQVMAAGDGHVVAGGASIPADRLEGSGCRLLIRPEAFYRAGTQDPSALQVQVETVVYRSGRLTLTTVDANGERIVAELGEDEGSGIVPGDIIFLGVSRAYLLDP